MAEQDKTGASTSRWLAWRMWIQAAFLLVWLDPLALRLHNLCGPVFHCYACPLATFACPIGVLANFSALHLFPFMAVGLLVAVGAVFGSMVCGWACPFGLLQDLAAKVPTPKLDLPRWTGHLRYVVLVGTVLAVPFLFGESHPLFVCNFCPAGAIEGAVPSMVQQAAAGQPVVLPNALKLGVLFAFLVQSSLCEGLGAGYSVHSARSSPSSTGPRCSSCGLTPASVRSARDATSSVSSAFSRIDRRTTPGASDAWTAPAAALAPSGWTAS